MQVEIKIVNKNAVTKQNTLLHAQHQLCMLPVPLKKTCGVDKKWKANMNCLERKGKLIAFPMCGASVAFL